LGSSQLATADSGQIDNPQSPGDTCRRVRRNHGILEHRCTATSAATEDTGSAELVFARVNKVVSTVTVVRQDAAKAAGAAGVALAPAFIILDMLLVLR